MLFFAQQDTWIEISR